MGRNLIVKRLIEKTKLQCNRFVNGECQTRGCLLRGGWKQGKPVDYSKANCESYQEVIALNSLLRELKN